MAVQRTSTLIRPQLGLTVMDPGHLKGDRPVSLVRSHIQAPSTKLVIEVLEERDQQDVLGDLDVSTSIRPLLKRDRVARLRNAPHTVRVTNLGGKIILGLKSLPGKIEAGILKVVLLSKSAGCKVLEILGDFGRMILRAAIKFGPKALSGLKSASVIILKGLKAAGKVALTGVVVVGVALCVGAEKIAKAISPVVKAIREASKFLKERLIVAYQKSFIACFPVAQKIGELVKDVFLTIIGLVAVIHSQMKEHCYKPLLRTVKYEMGRFQKSKTCKKIDGFFRRVKFVFTLRKRRVCILDNVTIPKSFVDGTVPTIYVSCHDRGYRRVDIRLLDENLSISGRFEHGKARYTSTRHARFADHFEAISPEKIKLLKKEYRNSIHRRMLLSREAFLHQHLDSIESAVDELGYTHKRMGPNRLKKVLNYVVADLYDDEYDEVTFHKMQARMLNWINNSIEDKASHTGHDFLEQLLFIQLSLSPSDEKLVEQAVEQRIQDSKKASRKDRRIRVSESLDLGRNDLLRKPMVTHTRKTDAEFFEGQEIGKIFENEDGIESLYL
jgi:hypothetical protein